MILLEFRLVRAGSSVCYETIWCISNLYLYEIKANDAVKTDGETFLCCGLEMRQSIINKLFGRSSHVYSVKR